MIGKILLTALVIVVVFAVARYRALVVQERAAGNAPAAPPSRTPRLIAYGFAGLIALSATLLFLNGWRERHEVITIRVINTQTGETVTYEAPRGTIEERSFKTVDGWKVTVSEVERVEMRRRAD